MPENIRREVDTLDTAAVLDRVTGKGQYHVRVATEIWKEYPLFGCGGWGYRHFCIPKMTEAEYKDIQRVGGINVHNDYLQFLAEHGTVGFGAILAMVVMLCWPVGVAWNALIKAVRFAKPKDLPPKPVQLFVLPSPVFFIALALVATLVHGFGDCPLRSPAVLSLFFASLAAMPGYIPKLNLEKE
jgi:O-antigen ligase